MSHVPLLSLPIEMSYWDYKYRAWRLKNDGRLVSKNRVRAYPYMLAREIDPWELRDQFLAVKKHCDSVLNFLNRTNWHGGRRLRNVEDFTRLQELVRVALRRRPEKWQNLMPKFAEKAFALLSGVESTIRWNKGRPVVRVDVESPFDAIIATIKIDKMMGLRFGTCARPDCRKPYKVSSRHCRKYCSQSCAHLENVRRSRKQKSKQTRMRNRIKGVTDQ